MRIIDFDTEESSNWNETCLNNSLNVSFLAFQITCTVKPDFFLRLVHRGHSVSKGLVKGGKENLWICLFLDDCWAWTPGSHRQPLLKVSWWATLILSATWPPSALWRNIFTDLQDGDIGVFGRQLHVSHNVFFQSWLVVFFSNSLQRAQVTHFSEVQVLKFCSANPVVVCYLRNLCWAAPRLTFFYFFL